MENEPINKSSSSSPTHYATVPGPLLMKPALADIVISINGRDAGKRFIVIKTDADYSLIADGKNRRYEKPKRKKNKHLKFEDKANSHIADKLKEGEKVTNNEIRRFLASYATEHQSESTAERSSEGGMQDAKR